MVRASLEQILAENDIVNHTSLKDRDGATTTNGKEKNLTIRTVINENNGKDDYLYIGPVKQLLDKVPKAPLLVPHLLFYENPRQTRTLMEMLNDFSVGEHLLLIGNQGVGKNKLADYFLKLLRLPREYIQLHRDTTVSQLTTQPAIVEGQLYFDDSPLVRAAKEGYVLVVDEADKAPTHVTALLKGLAEDREMMLGDGRRIRDMTMKEAEGTKDVRLHPDFRMIVLANRPGYPFLGNDFFKVVGSVFSTFAIDNPDPISELSLLQNYSGDGDNAVSDAILRKLIAAFTELRSYTEEGTLSYPYSTRELVNVVRHLDRFPNDGISSVLRNIFDFDKFSSDERDILVNAFRRQGIVLDNDTNLEITLGVVSVLPDPIHTETWKVGDVRGASGSSGSSGSSEVIELIHNGGVPLISVTKELEGMQLSAMSTEQFVRYDLRADAFSELEYRFQAEGRGNICGMCVLDSGTVLLLRHHIGEVDVQLLNLETDTIQTIQKGFSCPPLQGRGIFRPMPPKMNVSKLTGNRVLIHNPREHGCSVIDLETGKVKHYVIPFESVGTIPSSNGNLSGPSSYSRVVVSGSLNEELFACYCAGRSVLHFVHVDDGTSVFDKGQGDRLFTVEMPFPITSVKAVARELWIIQGDSSKGEYVEYHALQFGPRVTRTRLCPINRIPTSSEDGLISTLEFMSTTANRIEGRSVPQGMNDRLFRHLHSPGTHAQIVPGLGAALGAMRGGAVPIFTYLREDYDASKTGVGLSGSKKGMGGVTPPSNVLFLKQSRQLVTCTETKSMDAHIEIVSVQEGVVRKVSIPIDAPLPILTGPSGAATSGSASTANNNMGFSRFTDDRWKNLTSRPSLSTHISELKDGRLLFCDYKSNLYVLEVRTEEIMNSLEDWAQMVGSGKNGENGGDLKVGMTINGEEIGVGKGDQGEGDGEGDGDGDGNGDGEGDGEGNGKGSGDGDGDGDGNGDGEGKGNGGGKGGNQSGNRKGNLDANGDLPTPLNEFETMQEMIEKNLNNQKNSPKDQMTPVSFFDFLIFYLVFSP